MNTNLQQQVQWQHPERPVLLSWDIKARDYNTIVMTGFYIFGLVFILAGSLSLHYMISQGKYSTAAQS